MPHKTPITPQKARNFFKNFFYHYDYYFTHIPDPIFYLKHLGRKITVSAYIFETELESNIYFSENDDMVAYFDKFYCMYLMQEISNIGGVCCETYCGDRNDGIPLSMSFSEVVSSNEKKSSVCGIDRLNEYIKFNKPVCIDNNEMPHLENEILENITEKTNVELGTIDKSDNYTLHEDKTKIDLVIDSHNHLKKDINFENKSFLDEEKEIEMLKDSINDSLSTLHDGNFDLETMNKIILDEEKKSSQHDKFKNKNYNTYNNDKNITDNCDTNKNLKKYNVNEINDAIQTQSVINTVKQNKQVEKMAENYTEINKTDTINSIYKRSEDKNNKINIDILEEDAIKDKYVNLFRELNLSSKFDIKYIFLNNMYRTILCIKDKVTVGKLCKTKREAAESVFSIYIEKKHRKKSDEIMKKSMSDELQNGNYNMYINAYCVKNTIEFPEYLLEKQNDVFICKAVFLDENFTSRYFFDKNDAKNDVCNLIYNYIEEIKRKTPKNKKRKNNYNNTNFTNCTYNNNEYNLIERYIKLNESNKNFDVYKYNENNTDEYIKHRDENKKISKCKETQNCENVRSLIENINYETKHGLCYNNDSNIYNKVHAYEEKNNNVCLNEKQNIIDYINETRHQNDHENTKKMHNNDMYDYMENLSNNNVMDSINMNEDVNIKKIESSINRLFEKQKEDVLKKSHQEEFFDIKSRSNVITSNKTRKNKFNNNFNDHEIDTIKKIKPSTAKNNNKKLKQNDCNKKTDGFTQVKSPMLNLIREYENKYKDSEEIEKEKCNKTRINNYNTEVNSNTDACSYDQCHNEEIDNTDFKKHKLNKTINFNIKEDKNMQFEIQQNGNSINDTMNKNGKSILYKNILENKNYSDNKNIMIKNSNYNDIQNLNKNDVVKKKRKVCLSDLLK